MTKILLVCNAGMSTSVLVVKMEKVAKKKEIDCKIWAVSSAEANNLSEEVDVVLIGPQLKFAINEIKKIFPNQPVAVINMKTYGLMDGEGALNQAFELLK